MTSNFQLSAATKKDKKLEEYERKIEGKKKEKEW